MSATSAIDPAAAAPIRFADLTAAELDKMRTLPAIWLALAVALTANTALGCIAATGAIQVAGPDGGTGVAQIGTLMLFPVYAFVAVTALASGTEYQGGQLRLSLAAVPARGWFLSAKLFATVAVTVPAAVLALLPGLLIQGEAGRLGRYVLVYVLLALIGHGGAFAARTVVTPVAVLAALPVLVSTTLGGLAPTLVRLLPHEAALSFLHLPTDPDTALRPLAGLVVLTMWATGAVGAACLLVARRDV